MQGESSRGFYLSQNSLAERQASCCFFLKAGFERGFEMRVAWALHVFEMRQHNNAVLWRAFV
jgi:hypothetical protein